MNESLRVLCLSPDPDAAGTVLSALSALPGFTITPRQADYQSGLRALREEPPDLAVVIIGDDRGLGLAVIEDVHRSAPATRVLALAANESPETIVRAMRAGADEFLPLPVAPSALLKECIKVSEIRRCSGPDGSRQGDLWVVHGPKGGVGATTIVSNLAVALKEVGRDAALIDLDVDSGDLALFLNVTPEYTLRDIAENSNRLDSLFLQGTMSRLPSGLELLAAPALLPGETPLSLSEHDTTIVLDLLRGMHDVTLVDTPAVPTSAAHAAMIRASRLFLVTDLTLPALRACLRTLDWLRADGIELERVVEIVVNKHAKIPAEIPVAEAAKTLKLPIRTALPFDAAAAIAAVNNGLPLKEVRQSQGLANAIGAMILRERGDVSAPAARKPSLLRLFGGKARSG
jgi:pilus assembly protein CpaE